MMTAFMCILREQKNEYKQHHKSLRVDVYRASLADVFIDCGRVRLH